MKEVACQFAEGNRLVGILSMPEHLDNAKHALVLVSAGLTPKTGPFRLYTQIARRAAELGIPTLRFDLGGIGNSQQIHTGFTVDVRTNLDIKSALDYIEANYGIKTFILGGLCSGAEDSFTFAENDERVHGVLLLDGHAYITSGWWLRHIFSRRFFISKVAKLLRKLGLFNIVTRSNGEESSLEGVKGGLVDYQRTNKPTASRILQELLERGTKLHYVYTGGLKDSFNYKKQFYFMFGSIKSLNKVKLSFLPHMEHTQIFEEDRKELVTTVTQWLGENFGVNENPR